MLNNSNYNQHCSSIGVKPLPYRDYCNYEKLWQDYFDNTVIPILKIKKLCCVRLVLCESCPKPSNNIHPHPNYIFNNLTKTIKWPEDMYLHQIYKGVHCKNGFIKNLTKKQALIDLANHEDGPIIIVDLLPTHGIRLTSKNRIKVKLNPAKTLDINKLIDLIKIISKYCPTALFTIKAIFATPPSLAESVIASTIKASIKVHWDIKTANAGQGHVPSWRAICQKVKDGFTCS